MKQEIDVYAHWWFRPGGMLVSSTLTNSFSNKILRCLGEAINASNSSGQWFVFWFCFKFGGLIIKKHRKTGALL